MRKVEYSNSLVISFLRKGEKRNRDNAELEEQQQQGPETQFWVERLTKQFEIYSARPRVEQAYAILSQDFLTLDELDSSTATAPPRGVRRVSLTDLLERVPCTFCELRSYLSSVGAVMHQGNVRLFHPAVLCECVNAVLLYVDGHSSPGDSVVVAAIQSAEAELPSVTTSDNVLVKWKILEEYFVPDVYPLVLFRAVRSLITESPSTSVPDDLSDLRMLMLSKCLSFTAERAVTTLIDRGSVDMLLSSEANERWIPKDVFLETWKGYLPYHLFQSFFAREDNLNLELALKSLSGKLLTRTTGTGAASVAHITWCPLLNLPFAVDERVKRLFELCPGRWGAELRDFVEPVLDPGVTFEIAIAKVCRDHRVPGKPTTYSLLP